MHSARLPIVRASLATRCQCWWEDLTVRPNASWAIMTWEPPSWTEWQKDTCENITFPQFLWWAVIIFTCLLSIWNIETYPTREINIIKVYYPKLVSALPSYAVHAHSEGEGIILLACQFLQKLNQKMLWISPIDFHQNITKWLFFYRGIQFNFGFQCTKSTPPKSN